MKRLTIILVALVALPAPAQVTFERLKKATSEPHNWLTYSGDYTGQRYSHLNQITRDNVSQLGMEWAFQTGATGNFQATPLVIDGIMYVTAQDNRAFALDAASGRQLWRYQRKLPEKVNGPNRGFAALGDKLFMATLDAHVIALDQKTGRVVWDVESEDRKKGYFFTISPLAVKDKIIVGVSGGENGIRGYIEAYEPETGKRAWRFYTIPGPGEKGHDSWSGDSWKTGGAPAWMTGTYDPELNLIYWGTGNPGPDFYGEERGGDNLYSCSVVALDADTGKLRWYFQFTPHDVHDWDANEMPMLLDLEFGGRPRKLMVQANRNGFYYVLDRTTGEFLLGKPFAKVTWAKGIKPDGRPEVLPNTDPTPEGNYVCPGVVGSTNWWSPSYNPQTGLYYVVTREQCDKFFSVPQPYQQGRIWFAGGVQPVPGDDAYGALRALDPRTGELKWEFKYHTPPWAGTVSTAGGLVFAGDMDGYLIAVDAQNGKELWHRQTGAAVWASPMTYAVNGRQFVTIPSNSTLFAFALPQK
jgi:alcohol dehydrogenase (cytochrome c)